MQSDTADAQQFFTPAPTPPLNITAPEPHVMQAPKAHARRKPITTSHNLTVFEPRLFAIMPEPTAKDLINTMRMILTLGSRKKQLLDMRKQKIKDLLQKLGDREVIRVYNEFATAHDQVEKRSTFKLPFVEDLENKEDGVEETKEAQDEFDSMGARGGNLRAGSATDGVLQEPPTLEVSQGPDVGMEDVPSLTTLPPFAIDNVDPKITPPPSLSSPVLPPLFMSAGVACEKHTNRNCTIVLIQNPEAFPKESIQEIQAGYYPSASITDMAIHHDENHEVTQVTATIDKGPVDHLIINDPRIITFLGLRQPPYDTICLQPDPRLDETYQIHIHPGQAPRNPKAWIVGELASARHAYLYWLDFRQTADPKAPPTTAEARILAPKIGRRAWDVYKEIEKCWDSEQGSGGRHYRENRMVYLGEDPTYTKGGERRSRRDVWV